MVFVVNPKLAKYSNIEIFQRLKYFRECVYSKKYKRKPAPNGRYISQDASIHSLFISH